MTVLLALAWATLLAMPFVTRARAVLPVGRARELAGGAGRRRSRTTGRAVGRRPHLRWSADQGWRGPIGGSVHTVVLVGTAPLRRRHAAAVDAALRRELPVVVDLLAVAVGAGCTPYLAVEQAARWSPPFAAEHLAAVLRACSLGARFADAWHDLANRQPQFAALAEVLGTADRTGAAVVPALARVAAEERAAVRRRIEAHARRVPVRLLFPLVFLVLPAFVLLTVVPGLAAGLARL